MTQQGYALLGLTAIVAALIAVLAFAVLRFAAAARDARRRVRETGGESALLSAALQDAVGRLRAQERAMAARAEASERLNSEIVASLTAGLLVVGLDGRVRILNPSGRRMLGTREPGPEETYPGLLGEQSPLARIVAECLSSGRPIVRRAVTLPRASDAVHLGVTVSPLLDDQGQTAGAICLFTDLTTVVELEEQLRLKDTLARLGELTAGLAHEFRNGLATIHGYARLIDLDALSDKDRQSVQGLRSETEALGQVVTNFLAFARPAQLAVAPVDLRVLIERVADEVRDDVAARQGSVEIGGAFPLIEGDEVLLRQALSNLVRNGVEACARASVAPRLTIEGARDAAHRSLHIRVSDNGPGVDAAIAEKIFQPFFTTRRDGTGLGLALVQKIAVTHNGRVTVSAAPGGGAAFDLVLPLPGAPAGQA